MDRKFLSILKLPKSNSIVERFIYRNGTHTHLYKDLNSFDNNVIFGAETSETSYKGCGIKVAQNVLRYFNIIMTQDEIKKYIKTHSSKLSSNIWVYPDEMTSKLQKILNDNGYKGIITVKRYGGKHNDKNFLINTLKAGLPLIALVDNGSHYISIFAHENGKYYVHDNWNNVWQDKIDTSFGKKAKIVGAIDKLFDDNKYKEGTFIAFYGGQFDIAHVKLWIDANYKNGPWLVSEDIANFKDYGFNDKISSINVPNGMKVTLYEHSNYKGKSITLSGDVPNFKNIGFNDMASSLKISRP